jgi:hypothetical protein
MTETLAFAAVVIGVGLLRAVFISLLAGEVKGAYVAYFQARVRKAAAKLEPKLAAEQEEEWLEELAILTDRPMRAWLFTRGLSQAARAIAADSILRSAAAAEADAIELVGRNLMELSPSEFGSVITNLFERMGLEVPPTQFFRDGGADYVAWDARPIFGGKVVIQAKRYTKLVGVSAVRDLYGAMQNEGANKGILITTSWYGKASYEFARGKPLELLDGSQLLHLLKEHVGLDARIERDGGG